MRVWNQHAAIVIESMEEGMMLGLIWELRYRLGGSKKDRWRAQAELQGILGAGTRLVRLHVRLKRAGTYVYT